MRRHGTPGRGAVPIGRGKYVGCRGLGGSERDVAAVPGWKRQVHRDARGDAEGICGRRERRHPGQGDGGRLRGRVLDASSEATSCAVQRVGRRRAVLGRRADYVGEGTHSYDVVVITGCADCRKLWGSQTRPSWGFSQFVSRVPPIRNPSKSSGTFPSPSSLRLRCLELGP